MEIDQSWNLISIMYLYTCRATGSVFVAWEIEIAACYLSKFTIFQVEIKLAGQQILNFLLSVLFVSF